MDILENIIYSTVRIETDISIGTGFLMKFDIGIDAPNSYIITNKHVIKDSKIGKLTFCKIGDNHAPIDNEHVIYELDNFESRWILHPDTEVDLCCLSIVDNIFSLKKIPAPYICVLKTNLIPNKETIDSFYPIEDILMIGYPNGIWDSKNNKPVVRRGITATAVKFDHCGKKEFLIDAACFPGSSGSPIFIHRPLGYMDRNLCVNAVGNKVYLIGILYAGPQHSVHPAVTIPNNIGNVIKSERILELEEMLKIKSDNNDKKYIT
jgi:hypothetical protein